MNIDLALRCRQKLTAMEIIKTLITEIELPQKSFLKTIFFVILTLVGRGARYSGVMYLSPTLEIMVPDKALSLKLVDDVDDLDSSRIVMESKL